MIESFVVYDAGALVAAQRREFRFLRMHRSFLEAKRSLVVPVPAYVQVHRDDPRQHGVHVLMKAVTLHRADKAVADLAGRALRETGTEDAVDAIVAATALVLEAPLVTSDPADMRRLLDALDSRKHPVFSV